MSVTREPDQSHSLQIFKGPDWELVLEKSVGIEVVDSGSEQVLGGDWMPVDLRLNRGQDKTFYRVKLIKNGVTYEDTDSDGSLYKQILEGITKGTMPINDIELMLDTLVKLRV